MWARLYERVERMYFVNVSAQSGAAFFKTWQNINPLPCHPDSLTYLRGITSSPKRGQVRVRSKFLAVTGPSGNALICL